MAGGSSALKIPAKWNFSMALGDIIHVLGWPRCGLCCIGVGPWHESLVDGL